MPKRATVLPVAEALDNAFAPSIEALRALLGLEAPTDPDAIHRARTATRRLRSNIPAFSGVIDPAPALRTDLAWVGRALGVVRDADVLSERLARGIERAPEVIRSAGADLLATTAAERREANDRLRSDAATVRFGNLIHELDLLMKEASAMPGTVDAAAIMRPRWRALRDAVRALDAPPTDDQLHEVRIETKRLRYAAEVFQQVAGHAGRRFVRRAVGMQDVLGAHHDAVRARQWLLGQEVTDAPVARSIGWLGAEATADLQALREAWRPSWASLGRRKARFW